MNQSEDFSDAKLIADALMDHNRAFYSEVEEQLEKMGFETLEEKRWLCKFCLSIGVKNNPSSQGDDDIVFQDGHTPPSLVAKLKLPELITSAHFDLKEFERKHELVKGFYN